MSDDIHDTVPAPPPIETIPPMDNYSTEIEIIEVDNSILEPG
jgi:hypothetical protein